MNKNLKKNAILNSIRTFVSIAFPVITVPYLSRVLGKNGYGIFNYSVSIVSYFILLAGLGISAYAIREGAKYRENNDRLTEFSCEIFTLNCLSTVISYFLLVLILAYSKKLISYRPYIIIISISIIFITLGADWVNSIFEDYFYLTVRHIIVQIASFIFMVVFVRSQRDLLNYVFVYLFSRIGQYLANLFYIRRYVKLKLVLSKKIFKHLKPVLILFVSSVAMIIYVNSDITILGMIKGDAAVGVYSVASNIYSGAKQLTLAGLTVAVPRLASYIGLKKENEYNQLLNSAENLLFTFSIPFFSCLFMLSKPVILLIGGSSYAEGSLTLKILCIASIFSIFANYYSQCILIPNNKEKYFLYSTIAAAVINIILNFLVIPFLGHSGAALTTLLSEIIVMLFCKKYASTLYKSNFDKNNILSVSITSILICAICFICNIKFNTYTILIKLIVSLCASFAVFIVCMNMFDNKYYKVFIRTFIKRPVKK